MNAALEDSKRAAEKEYEAANELLEESEIIRSDLQTAWRDFQAKRDTLYKKAEEKAEKALQQAREEAQIIVDEVKQMRDQTNRKEHERIEARKMLEDAQPE